MKAFFILIIGFLGFIFFGINTNWKAALCLYIVMWMNNFTDTKGI